MDDSVHIDSLFYFDCSIEVMEKRLLNRSLNSGRSDDNPVTIKKRFVTFKSETEPFLEFYRSSGGKILRINADQHVDSVT
jgi:UMP-CMP kinase